MRRKISVKRVSLGRLYKELFVKLDKVYEKIKKKKEEDQENIKRV